VVFVLRTRRLERDELDLGIGFTDVRSHEIEVRPLFAEQMALLVSTRHPLARRRTEITADQPATMPLALLSPDFVVRRFADAWFRANQLIPRVMLQSNSVGTVLKLMKDSALATLLPSAVLREHRGLVALPVTPALPQRTVALLTRRRASTTLAANAFSDVLLGLIAHEHLGAE